MTKKIYKTDDFMVEASKMYMIRSLPNNWEAMNEDELLDFISDNTWISINNWSSSDILEVIISAASDIADIANKVRRRALQEEDAMNELYNLYKEN